MTDLRAECLAMAEEMNQPPVFDSQRIITAEEVADILRDWARIAALLRRVAGALPQEPQGDVVEAVAKGIYEADSEGGFDANDPRTFWRAANSYWPPHVWDSWLAIARAALSAAEPFIQARIAAAVEAGGWQPIETAPKDGTAILVFGKPDDIDLLRFYRPSIHLARWDVIDEAFCLDGGTWVGPFIAPSAWMPLPDPPALRPDPAGQQEEEG